MLLHYNTKSQRGGGATMETLSLFNIGFRCENIYQALSAYKEKRPFNEMLMADYEIIINESFSSTTSFTENMSASKSTYFQLMPLIFEVLKEKTVHSFRERIGKISNSLKDVKDKKSDIDVNEAMEFFRKLSNLCLSRNTAKQWDMSLVA